jgi:carboxyl-terminal processing protease
MVSDLDPHSEYLDANEYRDIRISTTGSYTGVGIEVAKIDDAIRVISPIAGSPAARSGIRSGDELIAVNGNALESGRLKDALAMLHGQIGSEITISVLRDDQLIDHAMRRQVIRVASVHKELLGPSYGYVRVNQFSENTAQELVRAVDDLQEARGGMLEGMVLDLRNNPGGVLDSAVEVSDLFLDSGVIVTAEGRSLQARFTRSARRGDILDGAGGACERRLRVSVGNCCGCIAGS